MHDPAAFRPHALGLEDASSCILRHLTTRLCPYFAQGAFSHIQSSTGRLEFREASTEAGIEFQNGATVPAGATGDGRDTRVSGFPDVLTRSIVVKATRLFRF